VTSAIGFTERDEVGGDRWHGLGVGGPMSDYHHPDPFSGTWVLNPDRSRLSTPPPKQWTQTISVEGNRIRLREEIVSAEGLPTVVTVAASLDGYEHPVGGSQVADTIAYRRTDGYTIRGMGKKAGAVSLDETVTVSSDGLTLTVVYSILSQGREVAFGTAVFNRPRT
jgi:hypothetical protein